MTPLGGGFMIRTQVWFSVWKAQPCAWAACVGLVGSFPSLALISSFAEGRLEDASCSLGLHESKLPQPRRWTWIRYSK